MITTLDNLTFTEKELSVISEALQSRIEYFNTWLEEMLEFNPLRSEVASIRQLRSLIAEEDALLTKINNARSA